MGAWRMETPRARSEETSEAVFASAFELSSTPFTASYRTPLGVQKSF